MNKLFLSVMIFALYVLVDGCQSQSKATREDTLQAQITVLRITVGKLIHRIDSLEQVHNEDLAATYNDLDTLFVRTVRKDDNVPLELGRWRRRGKRVGAFLRAVF